MKTIKELKAEMYGHNWRKHDKNLQIETLKDVLKLIDEMNIGNWIKEELKARING